MRKTILAALLMASAFNANADCVINVHTSDRKIIEIIENNGWEFQNYDEICNKLKRANAGLLFSGYSSVLGGRAVAWVSLNLRDKDINLASSSYGGLSTMLGATGTQEEADDMLRKSINSAVTAAKLDLAIQSLNDERKKLRSYSKK